MKTENEVAIIDKETGEILREVERGSKITILTENQQEYIEENIIDVVTLEDAGISNEFIKLFRGVLDMLLKEKLNSADFSIILVCLMNLEYSSGAVKENNGKFVNVSEISEITGLSRQTTTQSIDKLVSKKILHKGKTGNTVQLYVNPYIFMRGKVINKTLYAMFRDSKWADKHICKVGRV